MRRFRETRHDIVHIEHVSDELSVFVTSIQRINYFLRRRVIAVQTRQSRGRFPTLFCMSRGVTAVPGLSVSIPVIELVIVTPITSVVHLRMVQT